MNKLKITLLTLLLLIILPITVKADCQSDFKAIEDQFKVTYEYNKDTDDFTITLVSPDYEKYEFGFKPGHLNKYKYTYSITNKTITRKLAGYKEDTYYYLIVGADGSQCDRTMFKNEEIRLKKETVITKNKYSDSPLCEGNEDFVLCQKDYDKEIDEQTFESRLKTYKESKENDTTPKIEQEKDDNKEKKSIFSNIIIFFKENLVYSIVIIAFAIIIITTIVVSIKFAVKSRRLE